MTTQTEERTAGDGSPNGGAEPAGSQESGSLDSLLKEFETGSTAQPKDDSARTLKALKPVVDFARSEMDRQTAEAVNKEVGSALAFLKEADELKDVGDTLVRGLMEARAAEDKPFADAFKNRRKSPDAWNSALKQAREWAVEQIKSLPGNGARNDIEAAEAAVAGTGSTAPDDDAISTADMINMNGSEWARFKDKELAKVAG